MKSSASQSKPFQSRSTGEIPGRARRKERLSRSKLKQGFLIDSDAELFMNLILGSAHESSASEPGLKFELVVTSNAWLHQIEADFFYAKYFRDVGIVNRPFLHMLSMCVDSLTYKKAASCFRIADTADRKRISKNVSWSRYILLGNVTVPWVLSGG